MLLLISILISLPKSFNSLNVFGQYKQALFQIEWVALQAKTIGLATSSLPKQTQSAILGSFAASVDPEVDSPRSACFKIEGLYPLSMKEGPFYYLDSSLFAQQEKGDPQIALYHRVTFSA